MKEVIVIKDDIERSFAPYHMAISDPIKLIGKIVAVTNNDKRYIEYHPNLPALNTKLTSYTQGTCGASFEYFWRNDEMYTIYVFNDQRELFNWLLNDELETTCKELRKSQDRAWKQENELKVLTTRVKVQDDDIKGLEKSYKDLSEKYDTVAKAYTDYRELWRDSEIERAIEDFDWAMFTRQTNYTGDLDGYAVIIRSCFRNVFSKVFDEAPNECTASKDGWTVNRNYDIRYTGKRTIDFTIGELN